jgi:hypothetical protein
MTDEELAAPGRDSQRDQERQHREVRGRIDALVSAQGKLKWSVDQLQKARPIDKAVLVVAAIGVLVGIGSLIRDGHSANPSDTPSKNLSQPSAIPLSLSNSLPSTNSTHTTQPAPQTP